MATKLLLDSLEIRNFRAFEHLRIERLGRVNLIVGKNNVGKSSVLEALWLYGFEGHPSVMWSILELRGEGEEPRLPNGPILDGQIEKGFGTQLEVVKQLFHQPYNQNNEVKIGSCHNTGLVLRVQEPIDNSARGPGLVLHANSKENVSWYALRYGPHSLPSGIGEHCVFVTADGLDANLVQRFWDQIALTDLEDEVLAALRIICPDIERVNLLTTRLRLRDRAPIAKISGSPTPVPLKRLGAGMNRLFGLALALGNAKDGILLIDEIESGLHYSVQPDVWRLIFEVARRLNIQVFATTHSWDCLTAFQEAAKADEQEEGVLIRLTEKKGRIVADLFNEDELVIVAREGIEIR